MSGRKRVAKSSAKSAKSKAAVQKVPTQEDNGAGVFPPSVQTPQRTVDNRETFIAELLARNDQLEAQVRNQSLRNPGSSQPNLRHSQQ